MKLPYRILVLDDDEHALSGIVELLRDAGHHVTGAATYDAAKRLLAVSAFDLLITDVRLRSFNGLHLVMQTHADHPETAVIIITGYDDPLIELEANRYHAELVRKPIRPAASAARRRTRASESPNRRRRSEGGGGATICGSVLVAARRITGGGVLGSRSRRWSSSRRIHPSFSSQVTTGMAGADDGGSGTAIVGADAHDALSAAMMNADVLSIGPAKIACS